MVRDMTATELEPVRFAAVRRRVGVAWAREIGRLVLVYAGLIALSAHETTEPRTTNTSIQIVLNR
jgi:hypothetical protein